MSNRRRLPDGFMVQKTMSAGNVVAAGSGRGHQEEAPHQQQVVDTPTKVSAVNVVFPANSKRDDKVKYLLNCIDYLSTQLGMLEVQLAELQNGR